MGVFMVLYGDDTTPRVFGLTKMSPSVNIINKWSNEFDIEEIEWGLIFSESFSLSKNNKLSCFQYKLIHSVLALNPDLFKCKIKRNWTTY
jgi:hypothetical protein